MLDYLGGAGIADNIRRLKADGSGVVWRAAPPGPAPDGWDGVELTSDKVVAMSRSGWTVTLDLGTGTELARQRFR